MARTARRFQVVLVTCPTSTIGRRIAQALVSQRLAACVNLVPGVESVFRWQGKVDGAKEVLLIIKAPAVGFERLRRAIVALHPYEVPEVIALPISAGHPPYLRWVATSTASRVFSA